MIRSKNIQKIREYFLEGSEMYTGLQIEITRCENRIEEIIKGVCQERLGPAEDKMMKKLGFGYKSISLYLGYSLAESLDPEYRQPGYHERCGYWGHRFFEVPHGNPDTPKEILQGHPEALEEVKSLNLKILELSEKRRDLSKSFERIINTKTSLRFLKTYFPKIYEYEKSLPI